MALLAAAAFFGWPAGPDALGMINPSFTPVHLVKDSARVVAGKLRPIDGAERWALADARVLKGAPAPAVRVSVAMENARDTKEALDLLRSCAGGDAVLFEGRYWGTEPGLLLVRNVWFRLKGLGEGEWQISGYAEQMYKTYNGAADKLIEMVDYVVRDDDPDVPVSAGVKWKARVPAGRAAGPVSGMAALGGGAGRPARLFVASAAGDRLFAVGRDARTCEDLTARAGLDTASRAFVFVDLNGDGRSDLVSWDGAALRVRLGRDDGSFVRPDAGSQSDWPGECHGLAAVSPSQDGSPGLLASGPWPHLLAWDGKGWSAAPLPGDVARLGRAEAATACVAADWDGDGYADVLQLRDKDSLLWRGKQGGFAEPTPCPVRTGGSPARWCVGDFDTDGRPDLFVSGKDSCELWENRGDGRFEAVIQYAGSLQVKRTPGAADCLTTDLNHDGRPDLALIYEKGPFLYHFNRGYRCMGEEGEVKLDPPAGERPPDGPPADSGPVRAAVGDFDGDGSLDLAVALASGEVCFFLNALAEPSGLWIALPPGRTGPVTVSAWQGPDRRFGVGACLVDAHSPPSYLPLRRPDACSLKWRWPGGRPRQLDAKANAEVVLPADNAP